jgi:hypothetical protein
MTSSARARIDDWGTVTPSALAVFCRARGARRDSYRSAHPEQQLVAPHSITSAATNSAVAQCARLEAARTMGRTPRRRKTVAHSMTTSRRTSFRVFAIRGPVKRLTRSLPREASDDDHVRPACRHRWATADRRTFQFRGERGQVCNRRISPSASPRGEGRVTEALRPLDEYRVDRSSCPFTERARRFC